MTCPSAEICDNGNDDDLGDFIDCADPDCAGKTGPNGVVCCQNNDNCAGMNCGAYASYCDTGSYTCKCYRSCTDNGQCAKDYCCTDDPNGPQTGEKKCVEKGNITNYGGKSYLCDPPGWGSVENQEVNKETKPMIFESILNFFQNIFAQPSLPSLNK
ncbi:hypothetical protein [Staphylothermus hellenicus]|uniref:hypothetical protein n=1 Tax=Staphylothermus hellenicus TaxID=84599 RepID=UPI00069C7263|nr:hypothetical protein [Staphylothermus hellenicus]